MKMEAFDANEYVHINTGDTGVVEETVITDGVLEDSGDISDLLGFLDNDPEVRAEDSRSPAEVRNRLDELLQIILPQCALYGLTSLLLVVVNATRTWRIPLLSCPLFCHRSVLYAT